MSRLDELDVVIRRKNGKVIAGFPQLGLFAKADDVNAALAALDAKKKAFVADLEEAGELDTLEIEDRPAPTRRIAMIRPAGDLGQFALKAGIVVCCVVAAFVISGVLMASKVERSIENAVNSVKSVKIGGSQFWTRMEDELDRMARPGSDLPEAKKQKLLADIRAIAAKWRPFVVEIQSALADPNNPPRSAGTSANK
jgi:hypothetical protein